VNLADTIEAIRPVAPGALRAARERHDRLTKPQGSLGRLEEVGVRLAGIQETDRPTLHAGAVAVFAADHGVAAAGVSAYPSAVTQQMVRTILRGRAAVNALARSAGARLLLIDVGVAAEFEAHPQLLRRKIRPGTYNLVERDAMHRSEAAQAVEVGIEAAELLVAQGADALAGGELGIGNTTPAAAITALLNGRPPHEVTGRGTGLDDAGVSRKVAVIEGALARRAIDATDPLDVLAAIGGFEIAALTGFYLAGAALRTPVVIDGFIAGAAAMLALTLAPAAADYWFAAHQSDERGSVAQSSRLGLAPLLDLGFRLGEATGAVVALPLLGAAAAVLREMQTFEEAGVSGRGG
jgi:nicotinate-nucleotide--dimethylbenzimidazole phosphoribosyltransferase